VDGAPAYLFQTSGAYHKDLVKFGADWRAATQIITAILVTVNYALPER